MLKNLIVLPDGTDLYSGIGEVNALKSVTITDCVNGDTELTLGSVCAAMLEATLLAPSGNLTIAAGTEVTLCKVDDAGVRTQVGLFTMEKPTRASANSFKLTAYDRVSWLDKDLTAWLAGLDAWPYTLFDFAGMVCAACGLTLANGSLPNGDFQVWQFSADGITGRQLMAWIGEATAKFCRATADGLIEFAWYEPAAASISPTSAEGTYYYFQGSLTYEDYAVAPIDKVQVQYSDNDVGVIWPNDTEATNAYKITGNCLLITDTTDRLLPIAQSIYEALKDVTYTPCKVSIPANRDIHAGNTVSITDANGKAMTAYVMTKTQSGQRDTLECTGSPRRDSTTAVNTASYKALSGKVLNLQTSVEGIKAENADTEGRVAKLEMTTEEIKTSVSEAKTEVKTYADTQAQAAEDAANGYTDDALKSYSTTTEVQSMIDQTADEITLSVSETVTTQVNDAVGGLDVGGRNLLPNTKTMYRYALTADVALSEDSEGFIVGTFAAIDTLAWKCLEVRDPIRLSIVRGKTVTFSLEARSEDYEALNAESNRGLQFILGLCTADSTSRTLYGSKTFYTTPLSDSWQKLTWTATLTDDFFSSGSGTIGDTDRVKVQVYKYALYNIEVRKFKLEIGNVATDWTPAPDDQEAAVDRAQSAADAAQADVDNLANTTTQKIAELEVTADGLTSEVSKQTTRVDQMEESLSTIQQTTESFSVEFQNIRDNGVDKVTTSTGYTFNADGLTISKSGQEIENLLDNTGMYVNRSGECMLQVNNAGMIATDVTIRNYLMVGTHARFEDYGDDRTACFWR